MKKIFLSIVAFLSLPFSVELHAQQIIWDVVFPSVTFTNPLFMVENPLVTDEFLFVEQGGRIMAATPNSTNAQKRVFADLREFIPNARDEMGLLGLALSPNFASSGEFFVSYTSTNPIRLVIAKLQIDLRRPSEPASNSTHQIVLEIVKSFANYTNHNGGMIAFGPDQKLYIGVGDGGGSGDRFGNSQNKNSLWGKILRIDPLTQSPYLIPEDNPLVGEENSRGEIWAWGLRNPWRFSFDRLNGNLLVGDVGQNAREEINLVKGGGNYGWNVFEGSLDHSNPNQLPSTDFSEPIWEYNRRSGQCVTGGYVYRGTQFPELNGHYIFGDFLSSRIWSIPADDLETPLALDAREVSRLPQISSFAEDASGELYAISYSQGRIYKLRLQ